MSAQGFVASHAGQDRTRERIEMERDLATQRARLQETMATLRESETGRAAYLAETRRSLSERQAQAELRLQQASQEHAKAVQRERLTVLSAPVSGVVQQLAAHTPGGVVTEAQPLMVIVPDDAHDAQVVVEVTLENKDIGFVNAGQERGDQARDLCVHALRHRARHGATGQRRCRHAMTSAAPSSRPGCC